MVRITNQEYNRADSGRFEKLNGDYFVKTINANSNGDFINPFIPDNYDEIALTYVASGNGEGNIETVTYKLNDSTIATLTLSYDANNKLSGVSKT
jgi:hypothetical protein